MTKQEAIDRILDHAVQRFKSKLIKEATMNQLVCPECGMEIEVNLTIDDIESFEARCPKCGEEMVFVLAGFFAPELPFDFEQAPAW